MMHPTPPPPPSSGNDRKSSSASSSELHPMQVINMEDSPFVVAMFLFGVATYFLHEGWNFC